MLVLCLPKHACAVSQYFLIACGAISFIRAQLNRWPAHSIASREPGDAFLVIKVLRGRAERRTPEKVVIPRGRLYQGCSRAVGIISPKRDGLIIFREGIVDSRMRTKDIAVRIRRTRLVISFSAYLHLVGVPLSSLANGTGPYFALFRSSTHERLTSLLVPPAAGMYALST